MLAFDAMIILCLYVLKKISSCIKILFYCCSVNPFSVYGVFHNCL